LRKTVLLLWVFLTGFMGSTHVVTLNAYEQNTPFDGYNLFSSLNSKTAYLMDNEENMVHSWDTDYRPGSAVPAGQRRTAAHG
jgi:hypothetical protein